MINFFLRKKINKTSSQPPDINDIQNSKRILFAIFTRYGDTIISLEVVKEFIEQYPEKEYLILCPKQMYPYVQELLPTLECFTLNKRNLFELLKITKLLKSRMIDVGFNPWSNGLDSCFLISFCTKFLFYKDFEKPTMINHYQVVRRYLGIPEKNWEIHNLILKNKYPTILICPQSTDLNRNISKERLDKLVFDLYKMYDQPEIIIASMDKTYFRNNCKKFMFKKTANSSKQFLAIVKQSSLIVSADSGPLHIALALKKDLIALFESTEPKMVINSGSYINLD